MARQRKILVIQLKVAEAKQRDVGKGRARLDQKSMSILDIVSGDIIEIIGKRTAAATAWPVDPEDQNQGTINIDGQTRKNTAVSLNEYVSIKKSAPKDANSIILAPLGGKVSTDREFTQFVKNRLKGIPLVEGNGISVVVLGNPIVFNVSKSSPKGVVKIFQRTKLIISSEEVTERKPTFEVSYEEIGGLKDTISRLREIVELPLKHPEVFRRLGIEAPNGILLYGAPGCGKTLLAKALANESEANFFIINGPEVMNKYYGETEARLREIFKDAKENVPSIIFIDELDALAPRREEVFGDVEKRVVAQILALMDGLTERGTVIVIGATNRPESLDPALRRPGRFDREVEIGIPNPSGRLEILQIHTRGMPLAEDVDLESLALTLHGYTGADLRALCREAALKALKRYIPEIDLEAEAIPPEILDKMMVTFQDMKNAAREIVPTALREFYIEEPSSGFEGIGGLSKAKNLLVENIVWAIKHPERFSKAGIKSPRGVLLYGPSGCGKSILAKALAKESGVNLISVRGPEILSKWVGESEKAVREIFRKARASAPCIIFFDEIDAIAKPRTAFDEQGGTGERVISQLLTELESGGRADGVHVVAATNRPDLLDISLPRPGRLDLAIYIGPPDESSRLEILRIVTANMPIQSDVRLEELAKRTGGYSGADLEALAREAGLSALRRNPNAPHVAHVDFEQALLQVKPSINGELESWYESARKRFSIPQSRGTERSFYA